VNEEAYRRWWELHLRVARRETLNPVEQTFYDSGLQELDKSEQVRMVQVAREARDQLQALEAEQVRLEQRRRQLDQEIAALEKQLMPQTRQLLGVEE
jgi:flagellar motility protein MotE (MotC chaperone)